MTAVRPKTAVLGVHLRSMGPRSASLMAAFVAASFSAALIGPADAQTARSFGDALLGRQTPAPSAPPVARYVSEPGPSFVLDRSTPTPMMRFEDSPEVWVLRSAPGARGDVLFFNDLNQLVLRVWAVGGVTLYTQAKPNGLAAQTTGAAPPIQLMDIGNSFRQLLKQANSRLAVAAQRSSERGIGLEIPPVHTNTRTAALLVDTATLVAEAFETIAERRGGLELLNKVDKVQVVLTDGPPGADFSQGVLKVSVRAQDGMAGRPSSARMMVSLTGRR